MRFALLESGLDVLDDLTHDTLVLHHFAEDRPLQQMAGYADWRMNGWLSRVVLRGVASGRARDIILMPGGRHLKVNNVLLVGLGRRAEFSADVFRGVTLATMRSMLKLPTRKFAIDLPCLGAQRLSPRQAMEMWLTGFHQTYVSLSITDVDVGLLGTAEQLEDWHDPVRDFERKYMGTAS